MFGALLFGKLSDALGRKNLFIITLGVYLAGNAATALTLGQQRAAVAFLYLTRFVAGMGIGGEYAAINSAIDEMMPASYRGRVDIGVNGTYWGGAILGTLGTFVLLNQSRPHDRLAPRLPDRPGHRPLHLERAPAPAGEPALADHARP